MQIRSSEVQVFDQVYTVLIKRHYWEEKQFAKVLWIREGSDTEHQAATGDLVERWPVREHTFVLLPVQDEMGEPFQGYMRLGAGILHHEETFVMEERNLVVEHIDSDLIVDLA